MPSLKLLSLVHEAMQRKHLKYIPWQLRLSQKQYQEAIEAKATKMPKTELQLLSWKKEPDGTWTSTLSAELPASLAEQLIQHMSSQLTSMGRVHQPLNPQHVDPAQTIQPKRSQATAAQETGAAPTDLPTWTR